MVRFKVLAKIATVEEPYMNLAIRKLEKLVEPPQPTTSPVQVSDTGPTGPWEAVDVPHEEDVPALQRRWLATLTRFKHHAYGYVWQCGYSWVEYKDGEEVYRLEEVCAWPDPGMTAARIVEFLFDPDKHDEVVYTLYYDAKARPHYVPPILELIKPIAVIGVATLILKEVRK